MFRPDEDKLSEGTKLFEAWYQYNHRTPDSDITMPEESPADIIIRFASNSVINKDIKMEIQVTLFLDGYRKKSLSIPPLYSLLESLTKKELSEQTTPTLEVVFSSIRAIYPDPKFLETYLNPSTDPKDIHRNPLYHILLELTKNIVYPQNRFILREMAGLLIEKGARSELINQGLAHLKGTGDCSSIPDNWYEIYSFDKMMKGALRKAPAMPVWKPLDPNLVAKFSTLIKLLINTLSLEKDRTDAALNSIQRLMLEFLLAQIIGLSENPTSFEDFKKLFQANSRRIMERIFEGLKYDNLLNEMGSIDLHIQTGNDDKLKDLLPLFLMNLCDKNSFKNYQYDLAKLKKQTVAEFLTDLSGKIKPGEFEDVCASFRLPVAAEAAPPTPSSTESEKPSGGAAAQLAMKILTAKKAKEAARSAQMAAAAAKNTASSSAHVETQGPKQP